MDFGIPAYQNCDEVTDVASLGQCLDSGLINKVGETPVGSLDFLDVAATLDKVYAIGGNTLSLTTWNRNAATGELTFSVTETNYLKLQGARSLALSPDEKNVYVASPGYGVGSASTAIISWWTRDLATGVLTGLDTDNTAGCDLAEFNAPGSTCTDPDLAGVNDVLVSPDDKYVYAIMQNANNLVYWERDSATGALTNKVVVPAPGGSPPEGTSFIRSFSGTMDPDGLNLYTFAPGGGVTGLLSWTRDPVDGSLTFQKYIVKQPGFIAGVVSPDGKHMYVVSNARNGISVFDRDAATGELCNERNFEDDSLLDGANDVTVSPDGTKVFVAPREANAVVSFDRDASTGDLTCQFSETDNTYLKKVTAVVMDPNGDNLYAVSRRDTTSAFTGSASIVTWATTGV